MIRSVEIEDLVGAWFGSATRGDSAMVATHVSPGAETRLIGSGPAEYFRGGAAVAEFLNGEVSRSNGTVRFEPTEVEAFSEGSVGWATAKIIITLPDGGTVAPRWSSVFHQEDGVWKFVQTHASIAIANDQIGWVYPG